MIGWNIGGVLSFTNGRTFVDYTNWFTINRQESSEYLIVGRWRLTTGTTYTVRDISMSISEGIDSDNDIEKVWITPSGEIDLSSRVANPPGASLFIRGLSNTTKNPQPGSRINDGLFTIGRFDYYRGANIAFWLKHDTGNIIYRKSPSSLTSDVLTIAYLYR